MARYRTEPLVVSVPSGLLPESERDRRIALTSFSARSERVAVPQREVVCYECGKSSMVPTAALSANCSHCHAHLKMTDIELKPGARRLTVRTLGNVTVLADAVLSQLSVTCNNCYLNGRGSGFFRCAGLLKVSSNNRIEGSVQAGCMEVERGVDLILTQGATVGELVVSGRLTGRIVARKSVVVRRGGELYGNCFSPSLVVEQGGTHRGEWHEVQPD